MSDDFLHYGRPTSWRSEEKSEHGSAQQRAAEGELTGWWTTSDFSLSLSKTRLKWAISFVLLSNRTNKSSSRNTSQLWTCCFPLLSLCDSVIGLFRHCYKWLLLSFDGFLEGVRKVGVGVAKGLPWWRLVPHRVQAKIKLCGVCSSEPVEAQSRMRHA